MRKREKTVFTPAAPPPPVVEAEPMRGLSAAQVRERTEAGCTNAAAGQPVRSVRQIVLEHTLTYFNILFFVLAAFVAYVRSWNNMMFLGVVVLNTALGIFQELKAKKNLDAVMILHAPRSRAVRDGAVVSVASERLVRDDIVLFGAGDQICADAVVVSGACAVNEALVTGESDEIHKTVGAKLLSGSFVVSGECRARLTCVGGASFAAKLTQEAKKRERLIRKGMMRDLSLLIRWIGIAVIPLGILIFCKEYLQLERELTVSVTSTVGAVVGMIPQGLYLLTSLALLSGVVRLSQRRTLVHDMGCIEMLARVDTLCLDKTGTITEEGMTVAGIVSVCPDRFTEADVGRVLGDYAACMPPDNETIRTLQQAWTGTRTSAEEILPFSPVRKYSGVAFGDGENWLLGAPEVLLPEEHAELRQEALEYASAGSRVLMLGMYDGGLKDEALTAEFFPVAFVLLENKIRKEAADTFAYFREQGVAIKVISGDHPLTAANAARRAGIPNADRYVDARTLQNEESLREAAERCTVFGRVTPEQKRRLIRAMKAAGHTVAMTGDGVNDVLALKEADCSVAMASGSDAACRVAQVVLLDSDFSAMPSVVEEGRRVINNIGRSAALYLVKNIFSFGLALITLLFSLPYPFSPTQLTLVGGLTIGIPSFILAMEPNKSRIRGRFLRNVLWNAAPGGLADILAVVIVILFYLAFQMKEGAMSTICTCVLGIIGMLVVHKTCQPYTVLRRVMVAVLTAAFLVAVLAFRELFTLTRLAGAELLVLAVVAMLCPPVLQGLYRLQAALLAWMQKRKKKKVVSQEEMT